MEILELSDSPLLLAATLSFINIIIISTPAIEDRLTARNVFLSAGRFVYSFAILFC